MFAPDDGNPRRLWHRDYVTVSRYTGATGTRGDGPRSRLGFDGGMEA